MAATESQEETQLRDEFYDDPEKLSQLLRQRAGTDTYSFPFTTGTSQGSSESIAAPAQHLQLPDESPQQLHVVAPLQAPPLPPPSRRVGTSSRYVKPKLPQHQSAPTSTEVIRPRKEASKMYHSFNGANFAGDTQPDSQIYKQWTSGLQESTTRQVLDGADTLNPVDGANTTEGADVVASSPEEQRSPSTTSPTLIHDDNDEESQAQSNGPITSPLKISTPAMAGCKRDNQGHILSSAARTTTTPGTGMTTTGFFSADMGTGAVTDLSLTQAFEGTQAPTSPIVGAPNDDAVFQRPSPNFVDDRRSNLIAAESSPIRQARTGTSIRSSSEPRAEYITMKQSQERRLRGKAHIDPVPQEQDIWEDEDSAQKQYARRKAREKFEKQTAESFRKVAAPLSPKLSPVKRRKGRGSLPVSASKKNKTPLRRKDTYDGPFDDDELEDKAPAEEVGASDQSDRPSDEEADELSGTAHGGVLVPRTSSHPQGTLSGRTTRKSRTRSPTEQGERDPRGAGLHSLDRQSVVRKRNAVTILNSQPDDADLDSIPMPAPLALPSSPSTNQYSINQTTMKRAAGFTSQLVSSSLPPKPPESSSPAAGEHAADEDADEERVPSSPPALNAEDTDEDEVLYDEHNYDEHVSAGESEVGDNDDSVSVENAMDPNDNVAGPHNIEREYHTEDQNFDIDAAPENARDKRGDEAPNTAEHGGSGEEGAPPGRVSQPGHTSNKQDDATSMSRSQQPSTVPESVMMEDTQPSNFAQTHVGGTQPAESRTNDATPKDTDGTGQYHTAQERQTPKKASKESSYNTPKQASSSGKRPQFRSLNDIANQPETQQSSFDINNFELPNLGFSNDTEDMPGSSPLRPSAKKRKITYSAKRKSILSPTKPPAPSVTQTTSPPLARPAKASEGAAPSSTLEREERGASAATRARTKAIESAQSPDTPATSTRARSKKKDVTKSTAKRAPQRSKPTSRTTRKKAAAGAVPVHSGPSEDSDVEMADVGSTERPGEVEEPAAQPDNPGQGNTSNNNVTDLVEEPSGELLCPDRVLAYWPGQGYYPATCLGPAGLHHAKLRYDEGSINTLDVSHMRVFDLRIGDHIKVDQTGMKKHVYVVVGFKDKIDASTNEEYPRTDCRGYQTVVLEVKTRDSVLPGDREKKAQSIAVPVDKIYLTQQLLGKFRDRTYQPIPSSSPAASTPRVSTPMGAASEIASPSLSRRGTAGPSMLRESIRAGSVASTLPEAASTVFTNMAIAITLQNDADEYGKRALSKLVISNGGQVLNGFDELFSDTKQWYNQAPADNSDIPLVGSIANGDMTLKEEFKGLRFAALITDTHSRRTKYVQALALNIPCLHHRWLSDSITASAPLPFGKYLLPAGLSMFLSPEGVVRSRDLSSYDPAESVFADIVNSRHMPLEHQRVLVITGKAKKEYERKKPYIFLIRALGPGKIGCCVDVAAAKDWVAMGTWDWVYVDGGAAGLAEAAHAIFGDEKGPQSGKGVAKGKKRKKEHSMDTEPLVRVGVIGGKRVRLICDEFVIQSLILGALLEE